MVIAILKLTFVSLVFIVMGCNPKAEIDDLRLNGNKYYAGNSKRPFSGKAIAKFDNGAIAAKIEFKDGIPNGRWYAYGYQGEVVQEGKCKPFAFQTNGVSRLSLYHFKEGDYDYEILSAVTDGQIIIDTNAVKKKIADFFLKESARSGKDTLPKIEFVKGELDYLNEK